MRYAIEGGQLPVVICELEPGEELISQGGKRTWMRGEVETESSGQGAAAKMFSRMMSGDSLFLSKYHAVSKAQIAFSAGFPGSIIPKELAAGETLICQKGAFLAATSAVDLSVFFQKKLSVGFWGGEGFIMQKITGPGLVFLEINGHAVTYSLKEKEKIVCDTGCVALMEENCTVEVEMVKGMKNAALGREGLCNTVVTGPGKVVLQTMSIGSFAQSISAGFAGK